MNGPYRTSQASSVTEENNLWEPISIEVKSFTPEPAKLQIIKKISQLFLEVLSGTQIEVVC